MNYAQMGQISPFIGNILPLKMQKSWKISKIPLFSLFLPPCGDLISVSPRGSCRANARLREPAQRYFHACYIASADLECRILLPSRFACHLPPGGRLKRKRLYWSTSCLFASGGPRPSPTGLCVNFTRCPYRNLPINQNLMAGDHRSPLRSLR